MKISQYNFLLKDPENNIFLVYNSLKNSLLQVENEEKAEALVSGKFEISLLDQQEITILENNGMIVSDFFDELGIAKQYMNDKWNKIRTNSDSSLSLTITPTLGCNFRCFYCYEASDFRKAQGEISEDVQGNILEYIKRSIESGIKNLKITWYGGEPLLKKDIIYSLQSKINILCDAHNIEYNHSIVTNGLLFDKDTSDKLYNLGITNAQITIDGPKDMHNRRRYLPQTPEVNYETLIKNILEANEDMLISIRINIDKQNKDKIKELIDDLIEKKVWPYKKNVNIYFAFVESGIGCSNNTYGLDINETYIIEDQLRHYQVERYNEIFQTDKAKLEFKYPHKGGNITCAHGVANNVWVIDYEGKLYRCWEAVGQDSLSVGTIKDLLNDFGREITQKLNNNDKRREKWGCYQCKYLPICSVRCPWEFLENTDVRKCVDWKHALEYRLITQYKQYKENPDIFHKALFIK